VRHRLGLPRPDRPLSADDRTEAPPPSPRRWAMIAFAFAATTLNYVQRLSFTYLSVHPDLRALFSDTAFGALGTAFFVAYTISNGLSGFAIDRLGTRLGYAACMAFWTTAAALHALARTPLQFGALRFLLGIGEAGNWPAAVKLTAEWFPPHERSTASGIFNSGSALGSVIAPPLLAWLGVSFGWRSAFLAVGALGYLWLAAFWFLYGTPPSAASAPALPPVPARRLLRHRFVAWFTASKFFMDSIWYFITFWIGRYLADVYSWDLARIGLYAMFPFVVADVGNVTGGLFTQLAIRRGVPVPRARKLAVTLFALTMAGALLSGPLVIQGPRSALAVLAVAGFGWAAYTANTLAFPADVVPARATATVWGLASVGAGLGGAFFQQASGLAIARLRGTLGVAAAYHAVFVAYGLVALAGLAIVLFPMGPLERDEALQ
jgi:ACS family hexuronate transporter-like MFS transporter